MDDYFVLIHSPLVGPLTWSLVAEDMRRRGIDVLAPTLHDGDTGLPYWQQCATAMSGALEGVPADRALILIGHSGAGPLLPAIGWSSGHRIGAYVFVDAGLPLDGRSRLDGMEASDPTTATHLRQHLAAGGRFPEWSEDDLRDALPDVRLRRQMVAELRPRPLAFFEEPIPGFANGPDAPCGYLKFSPPYAPDAERAQRDGWAYREIEAAHFHVLVDPAGVATALIDLAQTNRQGWRSAQ